MNGDALLPRRTFLWLLAGVCGLPARALLGRQPAPADDLLHRVFRDLESARPLGVEYLHRVPEEGDRGALRRLLGLPSGEESVSEHELQALVSSLSERHREDFRQGRVARIDGWTLGRTELRLCALAQLDGQPH